MSGPGNCVQGATDVLFPVRISLTSFTIGHAMGKDPFFLTINEVKLLLFHLINLSRSTPEHFPPPPPVPPPPPPPPPPPAAAAASPPP